MDSRCCKQRIRSQLFMGQETAENRSCRRGRWRWTPMWGRGSWRCSAGPARRSYPVRRTPSASHAGPAQAGTPHIFAVNVSFVSNTLYTVQLCVGYTERTHTVGKNWWVRSNADRTSDAIGPYWVWSGLVSDKIRSNRILQRLDQTRPDPILIHWYQIR